MPQIFMAKSNRNCEGPKVGTIYAQKSSGLGKQPLCFISSLLLRVPLSLECAHSSADFFSCLQACPHTKSTVYYTNFFQIKAGSNFLKNNWLVKEIWLPRKTLHMHCWEKSLGKSVIIS